MTLDELLGPDWQQRAAAYTYHGQTGTQLLSTPGGAVQIGDFFLQNDTAEGKNSLVAFQPNGSGDTNYRFNAKTGQFTGADQTSQFNDVAGVLSVLGVAAGGAALGAGAAGGDGVMEAAAASDAGGGSLGGAATSFGGGAGGLGEAGLASDVGSLGSGSAFTGEGGAMTADGLSLGDGFTAGDLSFGADGGLDTAGTMSSLGSSLGGGTGFNSMLPLLGSLASGLGAKKSASTANDLANRLIAASDPFAKYRAGYGDKLQQLEASHDVSSIPGFQAGLQAVERSGAAQGFTGSGNMMNSLKDFGGNFYNSELTRLAHLAGADATPGAGFGQAAGLIGQGQASGQFGNNQFIQALGQGGNLLNGLNGGAMTSPGNPMPTMIGDGGEFGSVSQMAG